MSDLEQTVKPKTAVRRYVLKRIGGTFPIGCHQSDTFPALVGWDVWGTGFIAYYMDVGQSTLVKEAKCWPEYKSQAMRSTRENQKRTLVVTHRITNQTSIYNYESMCHPTCLLMLDHGQGVPLEIL